MRGGAQSHLMRCDDSAYYVVKFQNNPQHLRVLANEMLASRLASRLNICVPCADVVEVCKELIDLTVDLVVEERIGRTPCSPGKQFGSRYPGNPSCSKVYDILPDEDFVRISNVDD